MPNENIYEGRALTLEDFVGCGWETILTNRGNIGYSSLWMAFNAASKQAVEDGRDSHGRVLWLLGNVCSLRLEPGSPNEPFKPAFVAPEGRSAIADDFTEAEIELFAKIVDEIDDPWLKARLADVVWLVQQRPRSIKFAEDAIDSYRAVPLNKQTWFRGGHVCWERAVNLARSIGAAAGNRPAEIESSLVTAFYAATNEDQFFGYKLAEILYNNGLGRDQAIKIAENSRNWL